MRMYPGRLAVLCCAVFPLEFVSITGITFMAKTLQEVHGYAPGQVMILFIAGGAFGILGNIVAGAFALHIGVIDVDVGTVIVPDLVPAVPEDAVGHCQITGSGSKGESVTIRC